MDTFKGGSVTFYGLKEGGVGFAMDEYNKGLIPDDVVAQVNDLEGQGHIGRYRGAQLTST